MGRASASQKLIRSTKDINHEMQEFINFTKTTKPPCSMWISKLESEHSSQRHMFAWDV